MIRRSARGPGAFQRLRYWLRSAWAIARHTEAWLPLVPLVWGRPGTLRVRGGPELELGHAIDALVWKEIWLDDEYELGALPDLEAPSLIVDAGAGIGLFSVAAARRHPGCRILACEPDPRQQPRLRRNLERAGIADRVEVHDCAVATRPRLRLQQQPAPATNTTLDRPPATGPSVEVDGLPLHRLLERAEGPVALLKIDCEGAERDVLDSLDERSWQRVQRLVIEVHEGLVPGVARAVEAILQGRGYRTARRRQQSDICMLHAYRGGEHPAGSS